MQDPIVPSETQEGGRFFDRNQRNLGWAFKVSRRLSRVGNLTILDVSTTDIALTNSLVSLDHERLFIQGTEPSGLSYRFVWASGYANGRHIRIQGMLE